MSETYFRGTDQWSCCEYHTRCLCQVPSSPFLKMIYFTSKNETPACQQLEEKQCDIWFHENMINVDVGYKSATQQTDKWWKDTEDKKVTLI